MENYWWPDGNYCSCHNRLRDLSDSRRLSTSFVIWTSVRHLERMNSIGHNLPYKIAVPARSICTSTPCQRICIVRKAQTRTIYDLRRERAVCFPRRSWEARKSLTVRPPRRVSDKTSLWASIHILIVSGVLVIPRHACRLRDKESL